MFIVSAFLTAAKMCQWQTYMFYIGYIPEINSNRLQNVQEFVSLFGKENYLLWSAL